MPVSRENFVNKYLEALNEGNAAIFAGAGLSASSGCVNWKELLCDIAKELSLDIDKEQDLVSLAQYYFNKNRSRTKFNDIIINAFGNDKRPNDNHKLLSDLPIATFWTTNYDKLIEESLRQKGKRYDVKATCSSLTRRVKGGDAVIYKMHGDIEDPDSIVLIRDDYESYSHKRQPFIDALKGDLMNKTFLFLGFSFTDPNFFYISSQLRVQLEGNQREHYCILRDISRDNYLDESDYCYEKVKLQYFIDDLKRFNIKTVLVEQYSEITDILQEIKFKYNSRTVYISGAAAEFKPDGRQAYEYFISKLSGALINKNYRIVSGYGLGVGSSVISGALTEIYQNQKKSLTNQIILRPFPQGDDEIKKLWQQYREDMISYSGISIFILGNKLENDKIVLSDGMRAEFDISRKQGNFLIPVGRTGYISKELWKEYMDEISSKEEFIPYRQAFQKIGSESIPLNELINEILTIIQNVK